MNGLFMFFSLLYWFRYKVVCEIILSVQSPHQTENLDSDVFPSSPIHLFLMK